METNLCGQWRDGKGLTDGVEEAYFFLPTTSSS